MNKKKALTTKEILLKGRPLADKEMFIKSLDGNVTLKNITFSQVVAMRSLHSKEDYPVALVAACLGMEFEEAQQLQENVFVFSELFTAVNEFLGGFTEATTKN